VIVAKSEWKSTTDIVDAAVEVLEAENPMTLRQCFYRLVSLGILENTRAKYQSLSVILTKARNLVGRNGEHGIELGIELAEQTARRHVEVHCRVEELSVPGSADIQTRGDVQIIERGSPRQHERFS
jgi:hypothetical protein